MYLIKDILIMYLIKDILIMYLIKDTIFQLLVPYFCTALLNQPPGSLNNMLFLEKYSFKEIIIKHCPRGAFHFAHNKVQNKSLAMFIKQNCCKTSFQNIVGIIIIFFSLQILVHSSVSYLEIYLSPMCPRQTL